MAHRSHDSVQKAMQVIRSVKTTTGPLAKMFWCPHCQFSVRMPLGRPGVGRGYGLAASSHYRAQVVKHIREVHADRIQF